MILEYANLARVGHKIMSYTIYFPSTKKKRYVKVDEARDENVQKK